MEQKQRGDLLSSFLFHLVCGFTVFNINKLTNSLCLVREIPEERQDKVFRMINVLILILLISSFIEISFTV